MPDVVFTKRLTVGEEDDEKLISMLCAYVVFNVAQVEGLPETAAPSPYRWRGATRRQTAT